MSVGAFFGSASPAWLANDPLEIPIPTQGGAAYPLFSIRTVLDGQSYGLTFYYCAREDRWYLTIRDINEAVLVAGLKLIANWPLLRRCQHVPGIPRGNLTCVDYSAQGGESPGLSDLGTRCRLLYYPVTP